MTAKPHYKAIADRRQKTQKMLLEITGMTYYDYNVLLFDLGVCLVDRYFDRLGDEPVVVHVKDQLLKNDKCGFWKFFTIMISEVNETYWNEVRPTYMLSVEKRGEEYSADQLIHYWRIELWSFIDKPLSRERLRHFIIENEKTIFHDKPAVHQEV